MQEDEGSGVALRFGASALITCWVFFGSLDYTHLHHLYRIFYLFFFIINFLFIYFFIINFLFFFL